MAPQNVEEGEEELTPKQRNTAARIAFVTTVGDIYSNAISSEVRATADGRLLLTATVRALQNATRHHELHPDSTARTRVRPPLGR